MKSNKLFLSLFLLVAVSGCVKEQVEDYNAKLYVTSLLNSVYYWNNKVPSDVPMKNNSIYDFYSASLYSGDRWSWMTSYEEWINSENGVHSSYGVSLSQPIEYYGDFSVKVRYVFPGSPLAEKGVTRGWTLTHLNKVPIMDLVKDDTFNEVYSRTSNDFTFLDLDGNEHSFSANSSTFSSRSYLFKEIYTSDNYKGLPKPVGYFNYLSFNKNLMTDISTVLGEFKAAGVEDLILDLRYNGGGSTQALEELANSIAPLSANLAVLAQTEHNSKYSGYNSNTLIVRKNNSLSLSRLFVITGAGSASASEVLINGFKPLLGDENVIMVGDTTYGKPNGMYIFPYPEGPEDDYYGSADYIFYPICFFTANSRGEQISVDGMIPTNYRPDDLYHDWGIGEDLISACLYYIANGSFPELPVISKAGCVTGAGSSKISTEEDSPNWGVYSVEYKRP